MQHITALPERKGISPYNSPSLYHLRALLVKMSNLAEDQLNADNVRYVPQSCPVPKQGCFWGQFSNHHLLANGGGN